MRTGTSNKSLPPESEARKMGGEWDKMGVMDEAEVVYISGDDGVDRIYPPKEYRKHIIELTSGHHPGHLLHTLQVAQDETVDKTTHLKLQDMLQTQACQNRS